MVNKIQSIFLSSMALMPMGVMAFEDGSKDSPFTISSVGDLIALQKAVNGGVSYHNAELTEGAEGYYFVLTQDIDLTKDNLIRKKGWIPIGTESVPFKGKFDGKGNKIIFDSKKNSTPFVLFGNADNAEIKNVLIDTKNSESLGINNVCRNEGSSLIFSCAVTDTLPSNFSQFVHSSYTYYGVSQVKTRNYENGSFEHPFVITDEMDFVQFSKSIRGGSPFHNSEIELGGKNAHFVLGCDIDIKKLVSQGYTQWIPIGSPEMPFRGHFSGNGHTISNLSIITPTKSFIGLFGYTDGAVIENVILASAHIEALYDSGLLVGYAANTEVRNCKVSGELSGFRWLGAVCGEAYNTVVGTCDVDCVINAGKNSYSIGGIVGEAESHTTIYQCLAQGSVAGASSVGDICGTVEDSNVYLCSKNKISSITNNVELVDLNSLLFSRAR